MELNAHDNSQGILLPYQRRFAEDPAMGAIWEATRQAAGKTFTLSLKAVTETEGSLRPIESVFGSASLRQSLKASREARKHIRVLKIATDGEFYDEKENRETIVFPGDRLLHFVPSNPDTIRGFSGNVYLDEFAFHPDDREIWKAIFPTITRGYKIRIASSHKGKKTKFYELTRNPAYSHHHTDIYEAIEQGFDLRDEDGNQLTPDDLRLLLADDEAWEEEYLVIASDETTAFLTHEMISRVEDADIDHEPWWVEELIKKAQEAHIYYRQYKIDPPWWQREAVRLTEALKDLEDLYLGYDVARRRHLSVIWLLEKKALYRYTQAIISLKKQPFYVQKKVLFALMALPNVRRGCIDETGIGMQLAEEAVDTFGSSKAEPITFTPANKEILAGAVKDSIDDLAVWIPKDEAIHRSLHSVKRYPTATGHFRFDADATDEIGHADEFWALGLGIQAGSVPIGVIEYQSTGEYRQSTGDTMDRFVRG